MHNLVIADGTSIGLLHRKIAKDLQRSKIKHDKAVKDGRTAKHRVLLAQDLILAVKCTYFRYPLKNIMSNN